MADAAARGASLAISGERRDDERRVILAEPFVIDAEARRDARTESLDHDGGLVREAFEGRASPVGLEVERERVRPGRQGTCGEGRAEPGVRRLAAARGPLDPNDLRAEVAQHRQAVEARQGVADGDDDGAGERRTRPAQAASLR